MSRDRFEARRGSFGAAAEEYERGRPGYPPEAVLACLPGERARRVLDLGAGTGKLTRVLLEVAADAEVVALEPIDEMRAALPAGATAVAGRAEELPFADGAFDAVVSGQAWHWFDHARVLPEIARVLRPGGRLGALWNAFDDSVPWVAAVCDLIGNEDRVSRFTRQRAPWEAGRGLAAPGCLRFPHVQRSDAGMLVANAASRSTVILTPEPGRTELLERIRALAPSDGWFDVPYVTDVWVGERLQPGA